MPERSSWSTLVPHQGPMALIERVIAYDADAIHAASDNQRDPQHPLRRDGRLSAVHLCEYGAQAMAVHGALVSRDSGAPARPGLLVALRAVELAVSRIDDLSGELEIEARREHADEQAWRYRFEVRNEGRLLASGQAMVVLDGSGAWT